MIAGPLRKTHGLKVSCATAELEAHLEHQVESGGLLALVLVSRVRWSCQRRNWGDSGFIAIIPNLNFLRSYRHSLTGLKHQPCVWPCLLCPFQVVFFVKLPAAYRPMWLPGSRI